jgi:hypothetical protein
VSRFRVAPHSSPHLCARESGGVHLAFSRRGDVLDVGHGEELVVEVFVADIDGDWDAQLELPRELLFELGHGETDGRARSQGAGPERKKSHLVLSLLPKVK